MNLKIILVVFTLILLFSCGNDENEKDKELKSNIPDSAKIFKSEKVTINDTISVWVYDCMIDTIKQIRNIKKDTVTSEKLIQIINAKYKDKVRLDFVKISHDTIFVKIKNSEYLTQQMGTSGADEYMISATFTLTELPKIHFVHFDFIGGDHASPGTYSRKYFLDWITENKELGNKLQ